MILSQRQQRIQEILQGCKSMRVQALIDQLDASPATVRRELAVLESNGVLFRTRGEIHLAEPGKEVLPYSTRSTFHARAKKSIAQYAAELITDHKNLALDSGSTTAMLAQVLSDRSLNIVTNSIDVSCILAKSDNQVICSGGLLQAYVLRRPGGADVFFQDRGRHCLYGCVRRPPRRRLYNLVAAAV